MERTRFPLTSLSSPPARLAAADAVRWVAARLGRIVARWQRGLTLATVVIALVTFSQSGPVAVAGAAIDVGRAPVNGPMGASDDAPLENGSEDEREGESEEDRVKDVDDDAKRHPSQGQELWGPAAAAVSRWGERRDEAVEDPSQRRVDRPPRV